MKRFLVIKLLMIFCVNAYSFSGTIDFHNYSFLKWLDSIKKNKVQNPECNHAQENLVAKPRYEEFLNSVSCNYGQRIRQVQYSAKLPMLYDDITKAKFKEGHIEGKTTEKFYGISSFNDVLVLEKVTKNEKVIGYNVTLSLCEYGTLLPKDSIVESLEFQGDLILDSKSKCSSLRPILHARISNDIQGSPVPLDTIFTVQSTDECPSVK